MPELIYEKAEDVPAALKDIAKEKDGKFVANVVPKADLDDFRNRNTELAKERDNLTSVIGRLTTDVSFDPEKVDEFVDRFKELQDTDQQVKDGKLVKDSSLAQAVEAKTGEMKRTYEEKIRGLETSNKDLKVENESIKKDLSRNTIDHNIMIAINDPKSGANPAATRQILREAYETFVVEEGKLVPKNSEGNVIYGGDGATPMTPLEWLGKMKETTPFFFKDSQGGGAGGSGGSGGSLTPAQLEAMSPEEKMNYGREHGMNSGATTSA